MPKDKPFFHLEEAFTPEELATVFIKKKEW
jgi:hypothetical protein